MYAILPRACPARRMLLLSLFEIPGAGTPWQSAQDIKLGLGAFGPFVFRDAITLAAEELHELLGLDAARLLQKSDDGPLGTVASRRLVRCARLFIVAAHVLGDRGAALRWLKSPQKELGGEVPLHLVRTEVGARTVESVLGRMDHGK